MSDSQKEKYLGDIVDTSGKIRATIEDRQKRVNGIAAEILLMISEIPLGQYRMEIGLQLGQAMLVNGMLYNSEAWHSISEEEIRKLEAVDEYLLRSLVKGHSKTSLEFLYLEAGALPIRYIISSRRILYLQTILKRPEEELTRQVYSAQKSNPLKGDFCKLVEQDLQMIGGDVSEEFIQSCSKSVLKATIKNKIQSAALSYLKDKQRQHSKVRDIVYNKLETQPYMQSPIFTNEEVNTLHALRSRSVNVKTNFKNKFRDDLQCPLCLSSEDNQPHLLECPELVNKLESNEVSKTKCKYEDIFKDHEAQKAVTNLILQLLCIREKLVDKNLCKSADLSTSNGVLVDSDDLRDSIVHYPFGK